MFIRNFLILYIFSNAWMHEIYFPVPPPTEPSLDVGCSSNDECPDYTACENRQCINPCAYRNPCAPTAHCRVVRHSPICTCPDGYVGSPTTSCQLRKNSNFIAIIYYFRVKACNWQQFLKTWDSTLEKKID
jgi:hypothetical protein